MDPVVRENVAALNRRLQAIQAAAKDGEENEPLRKLLVEANSGLQAVIRVLQVAQSRGIKTADAPGTDGDIAILWGDAGVADGKLDE